MATVNSFFVESCNPPHALGENRGSYFKNSVVSFHNFQLADEHTVELWTKVEIGGGSLSVFDAYLFPGYDSYGDDIPCACTEYDYEADNVFCGKVDFWVSDCYTPVLTLQSMDMDHSSSMTGTHEVLNRGWGKVGYSIA